MPLQISAILARCEPPAHEMQGCFYVWAIIGIPPLPFSVLQRPPGDIQQETAQHG